MASPLHAKDIMVTKLVTLAPDMDVFEAVNLLLKHKISGAPVVDEQRNLLGVFSEKCCMSVLIDVAYEQLPTNEVRAFLERTPKTISPETGLLTIAQIFLNSTARRLPVLVEGKLVGQISRRDLIRAELDALTRHRPHAPSMLYLSAFRERGELPIT